MDPIVIQAMAKWPNVPNVYGWLTLDRRGNWLIKGDRISNPGVVAFIGRNYGADEQGRWYFQNGPQRVFVTLEYAPYVDEKQLTFGIFGKFSPITNGTSGYSLQNREIAAGLTVRIPTGRLIYPVSVYTKQLTFNVSWSRLDFEYVAVRRVTIRQESIIAGLGLNF